jgi:hypothetical protein
MPKKNPEKDTKSKMPRIPQHSHFLALLILVVGFSTYAIASFFNSTNDYIDGSYASITASEDMVPVNCATCPPTHAEGEVYKIFNDVDSNHKYAKAIESLLFAGVISGYEDGTFKPDASVNRAEMLTMLTGTMNADLSGSGLSGCFNDVQDQWFAPFVCYAKNQGWVSGVNGFYKPDQSIVRAEALKIVLEASDLEIPETAASSSFSDVSTGDWFAKYAQVALDNGIIDKSGFFGPSVQISRGELSDMLYRTFLK